MATTSRPRTHSDPNTFPVVAPTVTTTRLDTADMWDQEFDGNDNRPVDHGGSSMSGTVQRHAEVTQYAQISHWQRELANSRVGRHSRASSIISTRTKLTHQSDDAQSVEFEAGGQSFRISRDGARVTNMTAPPPPYPGPPLERLTEESDEEEPPLPARHSNDTVQEQSPDGHIQAESVNLDLPVRTHLPPEALHEEGSHVIGVLQLPQRLKSALGLRWYGSTTSTLETEAVHDARTTGTLRRTQSDSSSLRNFRPVQPGVCDDQGESSDLPILDAERRMQATSWTDGCSTKNRSDEQAAEISHNYTRIMRDMDHDHRKRLHERDNELARMRERDYAIESLKEEIRFKDATINDLKTRNYEMEEDLEARLEMARNIVENTWEVRWKEYELLLRERLQAS
ncbi:hypothetical protein PMZ80_003355 [Knufia obscura]|uniref:Uncharacterized protein n=2 Tax=Knufia TaxID=430999 RepID=A0AAN8EQL0_9EURO|nr:hypothetical protein PMZ80_003355 [Knufia obscura]KAK5956382.1 hypothetical protein OHC33_002959 [Knufia fluminis]